MSKKIINHAIQLGTSECQIMPYKKLKKVFLWMLF